MDENDEECSNSESTSSSSDVEQDDVEQKIVTDPDKKARLPRKKLLHYRRIKEGVRKAVELEGTASTSSNLYRSYHTMLQTSMEINEEGTQHSIVSTLGKCFRLSTIVLFLICNRPYMGNYN